MPLSPSFKRKIKVVCAISAIACTSVLVSFEPATAQFGKVKRTLGSFYKGSPENEALTALLKEGRIGDVQLGHADEIRAFYESRGGEPVWTGGIGAYNRAKQFAAAIEASWTHGLNPARYNHRQISDRLEESDETLKAELELFLTDAVIKYARDMKGHRLSGQVLKGELFSQSPPVQAMDVLRTVSSAHSMKNLLQSWEPKGTTYKTLQRALIDLSGRPEAEYINHLPLDFGGMLRPGQRHRNVPGLRARLGAPPQTADANLYDDALFAAVMKFQREASLKDDGVIGLDTLAALNRTNADRVMQLKVNMERLRWMEDVPRPEKFIVVNIPAATLWAVDHGRTFEMPVIVGRPERPTPPLLTEITGVRFNPDWTVPPTIKKEDILPKLREDPHYLTNKGIELTYRGEDGRVETLDPTAVDWEDVTNNQLHALNMVQLPGAQNPLGRVRVLMPNRQSIYLHDTNQHEYFDKYARALSSGCIRMKEPLKVADFIMSGEKGWDMARIDSVIAQGRTSDRLITNKIPVYLLYYTVWIDDRGRVVFGRDLYNRDRPLAEALEKVDGFTTAMHNNIMTNSRRQKLAAIGEDG